MFSAFTPFLSLSFRLFHAALDERVDTDELGHQNDHVRSSHLAELVEAAQDGVKALQKKSKTPGKITTVQALNCLAIYLVQRRDQNDILE